MEFALFGILPSGRKTNLQLAPEGELLDFSTKPFREWSSIKRHESLVDRLMIRIGSYEDSARLAVCSKAIEVMKARVWSGISPMSGERWKQKRLDDPANFLIACEHFSQLTQAFTYLNSEELHWKLRDTFNLMSGELAEFEKALSEHIDRPAAPYVALWGEFIEDLFNVTTTRTRSWILARVEELAGKARAKFESVPEGNATEYGAALKLFSQQSEVLNDALFTASWAITLDMAGYRGLPYPSESFVSLADRRNRQMELLQVLETQKNVIRLKENPDTKERDIHLGVHDEKFAARKALFLNSLGEQVQAGPEPWISRILYTSGDPEDSERKTEDKVGFVAYRLAHKQSDEEWEAFKKILQDDLRNWGEWIDGADEVRDWLTLHWIDGKEVGIEDDDINGARAHFASFKDSFNFSSRLEQGDFVVVDLASYVSYTAEPHHEMIAPYGDRGYILVVEADFDPNHPEARLDESPGYKGQLKVLGNLLWSDIFSQSFFGTQYIQVLWPCAMLHPNKVYSGPVVGTQLVQWEFERTLRQAIFPDFLQMLRERQAIEESGERPNFGEAPSVNLGDGAFTKS